MKLNKLKFSLLIATNCISLKELSELSGVSTVTLNKLCRGNKSTPKTIGKIAKALNTDVVELIEY